VPRTGPLVMDSDGCVLEITTATFLKKILLLLPL
jgi:hypothetical protein